MKRIATSETLATRVWNYFSRKREFSLEGNEVENSGMICKRMIMASGPGLLKISNKRAQLSQSKSLWQCWTAWEEQPILQPLRLRPIQVQCTPALSSVPPSTCGEAKSIPTERQHPVFHLQSVFWGLPARAWFFPSSAYPCRLKERNAIQYKLLIAFFKCELWNWDL